MMRLAICAALAALTIAALADAQGTQAQGTQNQGTQTTAPGPLGMAENKDQPVQIQAATLEVRDKNKQAMFSGNVQVVQGDTPKKCQSLVLFYGQEVGLGADGAPVTTSVKSSPGAPQGAQNIRRIEARGGV